MLGPIRTATVNAPDLAAFEAVYTGHLGYQVVERGVVREALAESWGAPAAAGRDVLILAPESGQDTYIRAVQGDPVAGYAPLRSFGWNAIEIIVQDVDALGARLADSPLRIIGPPADLDFSDKIRAMQVVGPADEVLYLTQIKEPLDEFPTPEAESFVGRPFILVLAGPDLGALMDYFGTAFGFERPPVFETAIDIISEAFGMAADHAHAIAVINLDGQCFIEMDQYPEAATPRPVAEGHLPPGMALASFAIDDLEALEVPFITPPQAFDGPPYDGRRAATTRGPEDLLLELIER